MSRKVLELLLLLTALAANCNYVAGLPGGAPAPACQTLSPIPTIYGAPPQSSPSPYQVDISAFADGTGSFSYVPGQIYLLQFGAANLTFRGILLQTRSLFNDDLSVGRFINADVNTQLSFCLPRESGITHTNPSDKSSVQVLWEAPAAGTGPIRFGFSVVTVFRVYWSDQRSVVINERVSGPSFSTPSPTPPTTTNFVTASPTPAAPELRLVDGGNRCEGRLEIMLGSVFGQACDLNPGNNEAMVICRELDCNPQGAQRVDVNEFGFSSALNLFIVFGRSCNGNESTLSECQLPGGVCVADSAAHAVAIRCGTDGTGVSTPSSTGSTTFTSSTSGPTAAPTATPTTPTISTSFTTSSTPAPILSLMASQTVVEVGGSLNITCSSPFNFANIIQLRLISGSIFFGPRVSVSIVTSNTVRFTIDPVTFEDNGLQLQCSLIEFVSNSVTLFVISAGTPTILPTRTTGTPSSFTGTPPSFTGTPSSFTGTPPSFTGTPSSFTGTPPSFTGTPPPFTGTPPPFTGTPPPFTGTPPPFTGTPLPFTGTPPPFTGTPPTFTGTPSSFTGTPPPFTGTPPPFTGTPPPFTGTPPTFTGTPTSTPFPGTPVTPPSDSGSGSGPDDLESGSGVSDSDNLFPFGFSAGDSLVPSALDGTTSPLVKVNFLDAMVGCVFFETEQDTLFVNTNGVLSFEQPFLDFTPQPFPLPFQNGILIAPFWADHNVNVGGQIFYRFSSDSMLLDKIGRIISNGFRTEFNPEVLFIATWDRVAAFSGQFAGLVNTYQVVIATDGVSTYVLFLYSDIQWGTFALTDVGFNAGDMQRGFNLPAAATTAGILSLESTSNVGVPGMYIFRVDQENVTQPGDIGVTLNATFVEFSIVEPDAGDFTTVRACFTAELAKPLNSRDAVFQFSLSNLTTATFGIDFIPSTANPFLTIPASFSGRFEECIEVIIIGDNDIETDEVVVFDLVPLFFLDTVLFPDGTNSLVLNILENDVDTTLIEFEQPSYEVLEDIGLDNLALRICINIFNLTSERNVTLKTIPRTAQEGVDYIGLNTEVSLRFGENRTCVAIIILEDTIPEEDECFVTAIEPLLLFANVTILDDDDTRFSYIGDSPIVRGTSVFFQLSLGNNIKSATCALKARRRIITETDCSSGRANFTGVIGLSGEFTPVVRVVRRNGEVMSFKNSTRNFRLGIRRVCSVHLINEGISTVTSNGTKVASIEWGLSTPTNSAPSKITFTCVLDNQKAISCASPYLSPAFPPGSEHVLQVIPCRDFRAGCWFPIGRRIVFRAP